MGDIADLMLEGALCEACGEFLGDGDGFPQRCPGCGGGGAPRLRPSRFRTKPTDGRLDLDRAAAAYLHKVARATGGCRERPAIWNDAAFQACHEAGYVHYQKVSNRWRLITITTEGIAHIETSRRGKAAKPRATADA